VKSKLFQKPSSLVVGASLLLGVPLALLLLAARSSPASENPFAEARGGGRGNEVIVGAWAVSAAFTPIIPPGFPPDGKFVAVEIFNSDGTMSVLTQLPGVTIGSGIWKSTGFGRYTWTFTFYRPDPSSALLLPTQVQENVVLNGSDNYTAADTVRPLDASGAPTACPNPPFPLGICEFTANVTGKRYQFATFNNVLP
jgi:hypothetical protein